MIAVIDTQNKAQYDELMQFLLAKNIKTTWCEDEEALEAKEDTALYELMMEEPREVIDIDTVKTFLKQKINASRSLEAIL
jgi:hypothetical protein